MKMEKKVSQKIEFKNAMIIKEEGNIKIIEFDKDGNVIEETSLVDILEENEFLEVEGFNINFKKDELK